MLPPPPSGPDPDTAPEASQPPKARPAVSPRPSTPSTLFTLLTDWFGIALLFVLWLGLVLLSLHIVVIPRTVLQKWPGWVPLLGGASSPLPESTAELAEATFTLPLDAGLALALVALGATPLVLSFGGALIAKWQQSPRARHRFLPEREKEPPHWTAGEKTWKRETAERICQLWVIEARRALQAQHRMMQHACLFGFAVSAVLCWSVILNNGASVSCQIRMMAVAAASAAITSFALSFGRITVRASIRDTSARMFAFALRAVITSVIAVMLLTTLLWHNHASSESGAHQRDGEVLSEQPLKNPTSFLMMGMLIALIGESVLSQITARAAGAMNLSLGHKDSTGPSLSSIDGMSEQDTLRLAEEGIDSLHALALASTAHLYFSTPYTLQRICDWQDQALLITNVGFAKAQSCREKLMIRGCIDLQRKAEFLHAEGRRSRAHAQTDGPNGGNNDSDSNRDRDGLDDENQKIFEIIRSSLGFISVEQARESLFPLAHDENVRRLRIYERGSVVEEGSSEA